MWNAVRSVAALALALVAVPLRLPVARAAPQPMPTLATVAVPAAAASGSSSMVAFDGATFYFTVAGAGSRVERVQLVAGPGGTFTTRALTPLTLPMVATTLNYDARHGALLLAAGDITSSVDSRGTVYRYDLATGRITARVRVGYDGEPSFGYDWSLDQLVRVTGTQLIYLDWSGRIRRRCGHLNNGVVATESGSGDGTVYLEVEDDTTVIRLAGCTQAASYTHRVVAESVGEDDGIVCDGVTFGRPAIWVRDSGTATMSAYGLPEGRCVLPTRLRLHAAPGTACATLTRFENALPLAGLSVTIAGTTATTDATGRACASAPDTPGAHTVTATFAGTSAWAPSSDRGSYGVAALPVVAPRRPAVARAARLPAAHAAQPVPHGAPAAAPAVAPQPVLAQAAQPAYGTASATQSVPVGVAVPQTEEQAQLAYAHDRHHEGPPYGQLYAVSVITALAAALANRHRTATAGGQARR